MKTKKIIIFALLVIAISISGCGEKKNPVTVLTSNEEQIKAVSEICLPNHAGRALVNCEQELTIFYAKNVSIGEGKETECIFATSSSGSYSQSLAMDCKDW